MAKDEDEIIAIIRTGNYVDELEEIVKLETERILKQGVPRVEKKYKHIEIPEFGNDKKAKLSWEMEEIRRCIYGYDSLPGKYYFYFNHCKIRHKSRGKIRPDFRTMDLEWFKFLEKIQSTPGKGIVCIKRRQVGMSWKAAADAIHDCQFKKEFDIGMNSKGITDSHALLSKVRTVYRNQSDFLRVSTSTDRRDNMLFAVYDKDEYGNKGKLIKGTESSILVVSPVETAHSGNQYMKLVLDEAGECFSPDFKVLMLDGSVKEIKDVRIGDYVMGHDSTERLVVDRGEGEDEMFEVEGRRGVKFTCNSKHKLALYHSHFGYCELTPKEYLALEPKKQRYYQLKQVGVEYPQQNYFFDPYWLGLWLGDGSKDKACIVTADHEILNYLVNEAPGLHECDHSTYIHNRGENFQLLTSVNLKAHEVRLEVVELDGKVERFKNINQFCDFYNVTYDAYAQVRNLQAPPTFKPHKNFGYSQLKKFVAEIKDTYVNPTTELQKLGILNNKHIPSCYLKTSRQDRLKLLAGLIDSDGYKDSRKDRYEITLSLEPLARDVHELIKSLGFSSTFIVKDGKMKREDGSVFEYECYRVSIQGNDLNEIPTRLPRKTVSKAAAKSKGRRDPLKTGFTITPKGRGKYVGITLAGNPLFLGHDYIIHHNCDELEGIWANAEDCIMQDGLRVGTPIIFGTMGNSEKAGRGLMEFWKNNKMYDLERFPFWGYNELIMDELGNDDIEQSVRWVIYNRKKKEGGSSKVYNKFIQKYPLNEEDAFLSISASGVGNPLTIKRQLNYLMDNPPDARVGRMKMIGETPHFEPNPLGSVTIFENPDKLKDGYTATLDPAEDDDVEKTKDSSDLGFSILARAFGLLPPRIVAEYCDRPAKLEDAYYQMALLLIMYGCKIHIEMNKGGWRAYDWFSRNYPELLTLTPTAANNIRQGIEMKQGVKMTKDRKLQMEGLLNDHLDNWCLPKPEINWKGIQSVKFLTQCLVFGGKGKDDDLCVSVGWNFIIQQADKKVAKRAEESNNNLPKHRLERYGGQLRLVTPNTHSVARKIPRTPFSR